MFAISDILNNTITVLFKFFHNQCTLPPPGTVAGKNLIMSIIDPVSLVTHKRIYRRRTGHHYFMSPGRPGRHLLLKLRVSILLFYLLFHFFFLFLFFIRSLFTGILDVLDELGRKVRGFIKEITDDITSDIIWCANRLKLVSTPGLKMY